MEYQEQQGLQKKLRKLVKEIKRRTKEMADSTIQSSGDMHKDAPKFDKPTTAPMNETLRPSGDTLKAGHAAHQNWNPNGQDIQSSADTSPIRVKKA